MQNKTPICSIKAGIMQNEFEHQSHYAEQTPIFTPMEQAMGGKISPGKKQPLISALILRSKPVQIAIIELIL